MKTIEQKAKAYDEALKWMRELYPGLHGATKEDAERYFSELRESEDERIRRTLVEYFGPEVQLDFVRGVPIQKIRDWLEKQKEQKPITESRRLANEVIEYLTRCGYSPVLKDDSKKEHFHIDIPRHEDDFWHSEEYKHCCSVLGEYYMEGDYGGDTYTLYIWRTKKEQKPAEWSEKHIADIFEKVGLAKIAREQGNDEFTNALQDAMLKLSKVGNAEWSEDWRKEDIQTRFAFYTYKDDPSVLYLSNVFVEEASRNHGFGTRILRAAEKVAEAIGAITICLKVKQDSPANAWYRKNGYGYVAFEDGYDWLEKNLEYIKPKKSIKWSGDDELMIESLIAYLKGTEQDFVSNDMVYWLEALPERFNLQPKQEWSDGLEEAARLYASPMGQKDAEHLYEYPYSPTDVIAFKAGASWMRDKMMKED